MKGIAGLNVRTLGVSRDMIASAAAQLGGAFILVQDDPDMAARAASMGMKVIYRQSGDETLSLDPASFVAERTKNAPAAAYLHLTNELDPTPELLAWTMEAMKYADSIGRKLCIFNFSTGRSAQQWTVALDVARRAVASGHSVGLHEYGSQFAIPAFSWSSIKRAVGGIWLVTEFGYALDAYHGWRGTLSEQQYADFCRAWLPTFAAENMPVLLFSYDQWTANDEGKAHGFGVNDAPTFLSALAGLNAQYPISEGTPVPNLQAGIVTRVADQYANVRQAPNAASTDIGDLRVGNTVQYDPAPITGGTYTVGGATFNTWLRLAVGYVAEKVISIEPQSAPAPYRNGVDVSQAQLPSAIDWKAVKAAGYDFAMIRATQGTREKDTAFVKHIDAAQAAGMRVGVYHAFIASLDGAAQADFFHATVYPYLDRLSFPLAVDVELLNGQTPRALADRLRAMCVTLEGLAGDKPMIYTAPGWWNGYVGSQWDAYFATLPLWVAHWTAADEPLLPRPWKRGTWALWQWQVDENGIPGYSKRIDVNRSKA